MPTKSILCVIPARGESTRLPGKNLKTINGVSLVELAIKQAQASQYIQRIVLITDDNVISKIGTKAGVKVIKEPAPLAQDDVRMLLVVQWVLIQLEKYEAYKPLVIVLLQPTSPLRTTQDIDTTIKLLLDTGADSADTRCAGAQNGAVYAFKRHVVTEQNRDFIGINHQVYEMAPERSIDVNSLEDLKEAERYLEAKSYEPDDMPMSKNGTDIIPRVKRGYKKAARNVHK